MPSTRSSNGTRPDWRRRRSLEGASEQDCSSRRSHGPFQGARVRAWCDARRDQSATRAPRLCRSLGWGVLADVPGREIVMGAVTQPWMADVVFRAIAPDHFALFDEPGYVKIAWTLRAEPVGDHESMFRTETRVATTDPAARARFRRYWAFASPGITAIRWLSLNPLKREAERRARLEILPARSA